MPVADNTLTLRANVSNLANKEYWLNSPTVTRAP